MGPTLVGCWDIAGAFFVVNLRPGLLGVVP